MIQPNHHNAMPGPARFARSFIAQLLLTVLFGVAAPTLLIGRIWFENADDFLLQPSSVITIVGAAIAVTMAVIILRKFAAYPGMPELSYILPVHIGTFGVIATTILLARLPYSAAFLSITFLATLFVTFAFTSLLRRSRATQYRLVAGGKVGRLTDLPGFSYEVLDQPVLPFQDEVAIVADLHHDHSAEWERLLAEAALQSMPVYHYKQVYEAFTGMVQIEHLSENSLGSLLPSRSYTSVKQLFDILFCAIALPLMAVPLLLTAIAIKIESRGPVFFRQLRIGYRGQPFRVIKFRTMRPALEEKLGVREAAITRANDVRITKLGRFLRRTRIDELPQIINILRGEMSLIGPRPEAIALSEWYQQELPFYDYRHIVRPGITGWAQINQGHVTDIEAIDAKLQYDFFYIKNFSYWLDILISIRTLAVILSGFGAK